MMTENLSLGALLDKIASPVMICENHTILFANPAAEKLIGFSDQELLSHRLDSLIYTTSMKAFTKWYDQRLISLGNESLEVRLVPADQSLIWVKFTASAVIYEGKAAQILTLQDITQTRKTETELYLSKAYRDMLMINNSDVVIITDNDGNITYISPSMESALGYPPDVALSHRWKEWVHPDDIKLVLDAVTELRQTHKYVTIEIRLRNIKGEHIWFEAMIGLVFQEQDDQITIISAARNIHKHKLTELALREREQRIRLITDNMSDIVLEIEPNGLITYISPSCFSIMGYQPVELIGHSHLEQVHPDDVPTVLEYFSKALIEPSRTPLELRCKHKDGHYLWIEIVFKLVNGEDGNLRSIVISVREISGRKQAQDRLQESQHLLQQIVDIAPTGIYLYDEQASQTIFYNQKGVLGYSDAEVKKDGGHYFRDRVHPDDRASFDDATNRLIRAKDGEIIISECRMKHASGDWHWLQYHDTIFKRDETGKATQFLRTAYDVTERKLAEEALRQNQHMLQQITDVAPLGIYIYDVKEQRDIYHNQRAIQENSREIPSKSAPNFYADYVHPDDAERHRAHQEHLMRAKDGEIIESENRVQLSDGTYKWFYFRDTVFKRDADGKPSQFLGAMQDITGRKESEQALKQSQNMLKKITDTAPFGIYIYDVKQHRDVYHNKRLIEDRNPQVIANTPEDEFYTGHVHPDDLALHREHRQHLMNARDGEIIESELRGLNRDGGYDWLYFRDIVFARDEEGKPSQFLGSMQDITQRKKAEQALRDNQNLLKKITDTVPLDIYIYDVDLQRNVFFNRTENMGYPLEVLENQQAGEFFANLVHPDDLEEHQRNAKSLQVAKDGELLHSEYRMKHASGEWHWYDFRDTVFARHADGSPRQFLGSVQDITGRKKAADALRENEEKLRLITDNIHDLVALTDDTMHYRYVTPSHERVLGYRPEDLIGRSVFELVHPDDLEMVQSKVLAAIEKRQPESAEFRFRHNDGYYLWLETNGSLALGDDGEFSGAIFASRDVSERRWMQRAMLEQEKLLVMLQKEQELSSLKTRMMSRLSHELRTPLAIISTSADLLDLYSKRMTEEQRVQRLQQIKTQVKHFTGMLDNISLVVKGISYSMDFAPSPYNLEVTAKATIKDLKELLRTEREVTLDLHADMSELNSDEQLMRLILTHLLANALKYSQPTTPITVMGDLSEDEMMITVKDQGIGIMPDEKDRVFEAFFRGTNIGEIPGLGIGLSIVKDAVDSMEGSVEVDSELGVGTTVTVKIPLGGVIGTNLI